MSSIKKEKIQARFYTSQELVDLAKDISDEIDIPTGKFMEIAVYYLVHCSPNERSDIISKFFRNDWPPKEPDK